MVMIAVLTLPAGAAIAGGDAEAGKAIFEGNCGSCHYEDDFAGKSSADILSLIKTQAAPDSKHKGDLSALGETEMADVAAFLASFGD
jgi:mono/diheme cytochrome c family protein